MENWDSSHESCKLTFINLTVKSYLHRMVFYILKGFTASLKRDTKYFLALSHKKNLLQSCTICKHKDKARMKYGTMLI